MVNIVCPVVTMPLVALCQTEQMVVNAYVVHDRRTMGINLCRNNVMTESDLQTQVADYLRLQYPDVMFHSDFGSGIKLTPGQAVKQKRQNGGRRAWPDMFVAEPKIDGDDCGNIFECRGGLFLELKKDGTRLKKKNGEWANNHIAEQAEVLEELRSRGYCAEFAIGFDEAKKIIDEYLGGK